MDKGIIALDIDGTVTGADHTMPEEVQSYLRELVGQGWQLIFITGRTFSYGWEVLQVCQFPFHYSVYNGAATLRMPEKEIVRRHELPGEMLAPLVAACMAQGVDPMIHTNVDHGDQCFWRPSKHSKEGREYLRHRRAQTSEPWIEVEEFPELESFAYAKVFEKKEILESLELPEGTAHSMIHDPLRPGYGALLITATGATKGGALRDFRELIGSKLPVIAAGDDLNDVTLLAEADVRIAMATAPLALTQMATIVAPSSAEMGIITGLKKATELV